MSPPNNAHYLRAAQRRHHADLIDRVREAVRELDRTSQKITVAAVVRASGASRAFIYRLPEIVQQIQKLRDRQEITQQHQPTRQRASEASKDARVRQLTATVAELRDELKQLRQQNSLLLGRLRERGTAHAEEAVQ
jgi:uncharacterized coiled-coil protein SlyX